MMSGRILVLDDEENYAEMLQELLREHNYKVDMATRPERALRLLEEIPYDLVISDYRMPVVDGAGFLQRARELYSNLPVILVSGLMNTPELVKVANMGVTLVMEKPLDTRAFLKHVARFSSPMSLEHSASLNEAGATVVPFPQEPRFMSVCSTASKAFMQEVWGGAQNECASFILDLSVGEAELALKDISVWRGNNDKPLRSVQWSDLSVEPNSRIEALSEDTEGSDVVYVQLETLSELADAMLFVESELACEAGFFFVFLVSSSVSVAEFFKSGVRNGFVLPSLNGRPSDVANYFMRYTRIATGRLEKTTHAEYSDEAVYCLLSHNWSSFGELQQVATQLMSAPDVAVVDAKLMAKALEVAACDVPTAANRLGALMQRSQTLYLTQRLDASGQSIAEFLEELLEDSSMQFSNDLSVLPLLQADLAHY